MSRISEAMRRAAEGFGASIRTGAEVARIVETDECEQMRFYRELAFEFMRDEARSFTRVGRVLTRGEDQVIADGVSSCGNRAR